MRLVVWFVRHVYRIYKCLYMFCACEICQAYVTKNCHLLSIWTKCACWTCIWITRLLVDCWKCLLDIIYVCWSWLLVVTGCACMFTYIWTIRWEFDDCLMSNYVDVSSDVGSRAQRSFFQVCSWSSTTWT